MHPDNDLADLDDLVLVRRALRGDQVAAREFYGRHTRVMLRLATARLGDPARAEDAVHDAFERVWRRAAEDRITLGPDGTLRGLLLTVVHRRCLDLLRTAWDRRRSDQELPDRAAPDDPAEEVARRELSSRVHELVADLDEPYREVLLLALAGLEVGEIAVLTGRRANTVSQQRRRALAMVAERAESVGLHPGGGT